jgi:AcrR family transcriptional regulator
VNEQTKTDVEVYQLRITDKQETRCLLAHAAAELIAERGWGQVTTRAIAERAGLPHGTVSYHFQGKHELLTEAALSTIEDLFPMSELEAIQSAQELIHSWPGGQHALDSVGPGVLTEAMREAKQNLALRHRLALLLRKYRRVLAEVVRAEQRRGTVVSSLTPEAAATLIAAVSDGLLLHMLLDSELNVAEATEALLVLLRR